MELPSRPKHDRYTRPGQYAELEQRLRKNPANRDIPTLVCYAFDHRTRLGPFLFLDKSLLPAGPRAVSAALSQAGFTRQRIVLRQWNPNFRPSAARLDGAVPEMLFVSSMQIHSASAYEMITDAHRLGESRPFILAGGAKAIYEPWDFFGLAADGRCSADVACTGEEYVMLELLDRLTEYRGRGEHIRKTFHRLRRSGLLDDIPGLVFLAPQWHEDAPLCSAERAARSAERGARSAERDMESAARSALCAPHSTLDAPHLINTGIQRMVQNLDEMPHPLVGLSLIEPPHNRSSLTRAPIPAHKLSRYARIVSLVTTHGCKFHCPYCPIPAYNQFTFRFKSPERLRDEMKDIAEQTGIATLFGTDDNFFNNRETVQETFEVLAKGKARGKPFRDVMFFGTEATEFDVFKNQDLLPLCRDGGLRAIWFGIEDMTAELVKKGQSPEKTEKLFKILNNIGICPMPMMMHHDGQPLYTRGQLYGLLNQVRFLHKAGSASVQVTILTPSVGSKGYEEPYQNGMVIEQAGDHKVEDYQYDGNHCIATHDPHPWRKQMNVYLAYASFYNPLNFVKALVKWRDPLWDARVLWQVYGMAGLVKSFAQGWGWMKSLFNGPIQKMADLPRRRLEMISPEAPARTTPATTPLLLVEQPAV